MFCIVSNSDALIDVYVYLQMYVFIC